MQKINLSEKLALFSEHWKPKIVGELNGQQVKLVKFQGPFVFVGSTICYAFMQAVGKVNDHLVECFRYSELWKAASKRSG